MQAGDHPSGPHQQLARQDIREEFLARLLDRLWHRYRDSVPDVQRYEAVIAGHQGKFVNDHLAFRTLAGQQPATGIASVSRLFEALGYLPSTGYHFPDKCLSAIHWQHPNPSFPKLFISELQSWRLDDAEREILTRTLSRHRPPLADRVLSELWHLNTADADELLRICVDWLETLPWEPVEQHELDVINQTSQYAAWVLVHGYRVNHFTALVNAHGVPGLNDIAGTIHALRPAGIPLKAEIEGAPGTKLRQTTTTAAIVDVPVRRQGELVTIPWTYAYFELAERGEVIDAETGKPVRFEGFLGHQAAQLFDMTKTGSYRITPNSLRDAGRIHCQTFNLTCCEFLGTQHLALGSQHAARPQKRFRVRADPCSHWGGRRYSQV